LAVIPLPGVGGCSHWPVPPEPIDLAALKREAESSDGDRAVVSRSWLARVHEELSAAREAEAALGRVFGRKPL
jgi:hypothetical protein